MPRPDAASSRRRDSGDGTSGGSGSSNNNVVLRGSPVRRRTSLVDVVLRRWVRLLLLLIVGCCSGAEAAAPWSEVAAASASCGTTRAAMQLPMSSQPRRCHRSFWFGRKRMQRGSERDLVVVPSAGSLLGRMMTPVLAATRVAEDGTRSVMLPSCRLALVRVSYDGRAFAGWSAANDPNLPKPTRGAPHSSGGGVSSDATVVHPPTSRSRSTNRAVSTVRSVQGEMVKRLRQLYGNTIDPGVTVVLDSCSRTDRGVHSTGHGMVALLYAYQRNQGTDATYENPELLPLPMEPARMVYALNRMLPGDVRITGMATVEQSDECSFSTAHYNTAAAIDRTHNETSLLSSMLRGGTAVANPTGGITRPPVKLRHVITNVRKTYRYRFSTGPYQDPLLRRVAWHVPTATAAILDSDDADAESVDSSSVSSAPLDIGKMHAACRILEGTHNFRAFQAGPRGREMRNPRTVCTVESVIVTIDPSSSSGWNGADTYSLVVTGDRFLYKMVRLMVGCVVAVGQGRIDPELVQRALREGTSRNNDWPEFQCAPAHGLALVDVEFDTQPGWDVTWL